MSPIHVLFTGLQLSEVKKKNELQKIARYIGEIVYYNNTPYHLFYIVHLEDDIIIRISGEWIKPVSEGSDTYISTTLSKSYQISSSSTETEVQEEITRIQKPFSQRLEYLTTSIEPIENTNY